MKVKVLLNNINVNIADDFLKAKEYFAKHNLPIEWEFVSSNITGYKVERESFGSAGYRYILKGHEKSILLSTEHITIFVFNGNEFENIPTSKCSLFPKGVLVDLMTYTQGDIIGETYSHLTHELMHAFNQFLRLKGVFVTDPMDIFLRNGEYLRYYKNDNPDALDGNYAEAWKYITPHLAKLSPTKPTDESLEPNSINIPFRPKNFKLSELVPNDVLKNMGEKAWELLDERMLKNLQHLRDIFGTAYVNTPTLQFRGFDPKKAYGGYRENLSQHNCGRACDITFKYVTASQVRDWLKIPTNAKSLPEPNIWVENDVDWLHFDVRYSDKKGVYFFNE